MRSIEKRAICPLFFSIANAWAVTQFYPMLKTISVNEVMLGMHIHALEGAWMKHPFWKTKFVLDNPEDLAKLQQSEIKHVVIDVAKGLDVAQRDEIKMEEILAPDEKAQPNKHATTVSRVDAKSERASAMRAIAASKKAVASMFHDVRMGKAIDTKALSSIVDDVSDSIARNETALISLARLKTKDDYTYMHSVAVCGLMIALARQLQLNEEQVSQAGLAGLLHDIGKAGIPNEVLNKPGALTDEEFALVKLHPERGHNILQEAKVTDKVALDVCLHHHEKIDGSGYPHQLKDEEISLFAKMGAVCDVYDAITSNRPYKAGWDPAVSLQRMAQWKGHFDVDVFKAFVKSLGIYPVGTTVKLKSGRLAIVIDQSPKSLLSPVVKVFFSTKANARIPVKVLDLSKAGERDAIEGHESPEAWGVDNVDDIWSNFEVWG